MKRYVGIVLLILFLAASSSFGNTRISNCGDGAKIHRESTDSEGIIYTGKNSSECTIIFNTPWKDTGGVECAFSNAPKWWTVSMRKDRVRFQIIPKLKIYFRCIGLPEDEK
jgi:hypothetical protein